MTPLLLAAALAAAAPAPAPSRGPLVVHTWANPRPVAETGGKVLEKGGRALDAVEEAIRLAESDPANTSVGRGGYPDRDGHLTLDASIMDDVDHAGSVVFVEGFEHPISVARRVMERTPHVLLAGKGAEKFAAEQGFKREELLTPESRKAWKKWLAEQKTKEPNHDTIGLLALSADGDLAGGCSTSGLAWKLHGRVGDSPLIGAGLYVDDAVGAATATGVGESVIKTAGSFLAVELMRAGKTPQEAVETVVRRIHETQKRTRDDKDFFVGFLAINKQGDIGAYGLRPVGYKISVYRDGKTELRDVPTLLP